MKHTEMPVTKSIVNYTSSISPNNNPAKEEVNIACVIMASGMGKRFGSNKLMADFAGKPLIEWIIEATNDCFDQRIVVTRHKEIEILCQNKGIDVVCHNYIDRNDVIRIGLHSIISESKVDACMFCPADQPLLRRETVETLLAMARNEKEKICRPVYENVPGAPVIFPAWAFEELMKLPAKRGGGYVIKKYPDMVYTLNITHEEELKDIDTMEDLKELERICEEIV